MKKIILTFIVTILFSSVIFSQSTTDRVLTEIEKNNTSLKALRKSIEANKIGNKTGIYPENPVVEYNYLWGNPSAIGNRTDFSISQTFDFPTAYSYKKQISNIRNEQSELEYQKQLKSLMFQSKLVCIDLVYINAVKAELNKRLMHAQSISNTYKSKYDVGESNILEYNKAQLNLLNVSKELESAEIERNALLAELAGLNGGNNLDFIDSVFTTQQIPMDFEQWYLIAEQNNPALLELMKEMQISKKNEKLNLAKSLPRFQTGYMSENVVGENFQGITVGLSIPLRENKNTLKYAKANTIALESMITDNKLQLFNQLKAMHTKAVGLQKNVNDYRLKLNLYNNSDLLKKALDKGEISLIDYILELSVYYESVLKLLESEKELNKTIAGLMQYN